jgi:4-hydroxy-tetrahydrodipicolinate synthase
MNEQRPTFRPEGVIPACLLPFRRDFSIDVPEYVRHLHDIAAVEGISALTVNGHASEVSSCTVEEQERLLSIALAELGDKLPIISGIYTDSSLEAARIARSAARAGASALLVFPPSIFNKGVQVRDEMAIVHFARIAEATDLPLIAFQYPYAGGAGYRVETLLRLAESIPTIAAIKDNCSDPALHERTIRELHAAPRRVNVLTTHSAWLLSSLVLGCDGILSGSGSVIADLQVTLWQYVRRNNLLDAREVADWIYHWTRVIYSSPPVDAHSRMKVALVALGRLREAVVRPPLVPLSPREREAIAEGLHLAGLLGDAMPFERGMVA